MSIPLVAIRSVLDLEEAAPEPLQGQSVRFVAQVDDGYDSKRSATFSAEDWHAMGRPEQVTVHIRPGDELNKEGAA